jgi:integrase
MTPTRDASKSKNAFFQNNVPIMDGEAFLFTTPRSGEVWQFRMWVKEENRQVRKTLRTRNLDEAIRLGKQEYASILGLTASGKKLFGVGFRDACQQWLDYQEQRVKTGLITQGRYLTVKTQINKHIVPYLEQKDGKKAKVGSLSYNSFYDFAQFRRLKHADVKEVTIRNEHTTIGSLIKWCFRQGFLPFEKCEFEEIKIRESIRRDTFTLEEYEVLFRFMRKWVRTDPDYRTARSNMMSLKKKQFMRDLILLNANNCMRIGELRQLTWGMVSIIQRGKHFYGKYELPAKICKNRKAAQPSSPRTCHSTSGPPRSARNVSPEHSSIA